MNWEAVGAVGEIGGAIGVIATLVYLSIQLRQNTRALQASGYEHWNSISSSFSDFTARYAKELSEIQEVDTLEDLSPEQFYILVSLIDRAIVQLETAYLLHEGGNMDNGVFDSRVRAFNNFFDFHKLAWAVWDQQKHTKVAKFVMFIDEQRESGASR